MATGIVRALGQAAKQLREEKGLSREEMAVALQKQGTNGSLPTLSRFENGTLYRKLDDRLALYAEKTGVSLIDLFALAEKKLTEAEQARLDRAAEKSGKAARKAGGARKKAPRKSSGRPRPKRK